MRGPRTHDGHHRPLMPRDVRRPRRRRGPVCGAHVSTRRDLPVSLLRHTGLPHPAGATGRQGTTPIIGYLHGSHWDPTDTYRSEAYPGLKWLDLANLMALIVSPPMHDNRPDAAVRAFHMSGSHHIPACTGPVSPYRGMSALRCHA